MGSGFDVFDQSKCRKMNENLIRTGLVTINELVSDNMLTKVVLRSKNAFQGH